MTFDLSSAASITEGGKFLTPGIHNVKFKGVSYDTLVSQNNGESYNIMKLDLDVDGYGDFTHNFFEPTSEERTPNNFGGLNPSQADHFMVSIKQIIDALDPELFAKIMTEGVEVNGKKVKLSGTFKQIVNLIKFLTDPYIGTELECKFIPNNKGFSSIPSYPAKINRAGGVVYSTKFIGHNLFLNQSEEKKIASVNNAAPTNMAEQPGDNNLDAIANTLGVNTDDDLPF